MLKRIEQAPETFLYHAKHYKCYKEYVLQKTLDKIAATKRAREEAVGVCIQYFNVVKIVINK